MTVDGAVRPPLATDTARYSHAVFQTTTGATFQKMNQNFDRLSAKVDSVKHTIVLKNPADTAWRGALTYQRPAPNRLVLDGDMGGKRVQLVMTHHELEKFLLLNRGFHWVQEFPVNR